MSNFPELEALYLEAKRLIKAKDFSSASSLLKQILAEDEGYKDASRLLASIVDRKRYRWYKDWRVWGGGISVLVILLLAMMAQRWLSNRPEPESTPSTTKMVNDTPIPTITPIVESTPTIDPNRDRFEWKRINSGKTFLRDEITSLSIYTRDESIMYISTAHSGLYKTIDGGNSWQPIMSGLKEDAFKTILVYQTDASKVLALSSDGVLYRSENAGENWEILEDLQHTSLILEDPKNPQTLFGFRKGALYTSINWGTDWKLIQKSKCPDDIETISIDQIDSTVLYAKLGASASCESGIYQSTDAGQNWSILNGLSDSIIDFAASGSHIYASISGDPFGQEWGLKVSQDGGKTWSGYKRFTQYLNCLKLTVDVMDEEIAYCRIYDGAKSSIIYRTVDGGENWFRIAEVLNFNLTSFRSVADDSSRVFAIGYGLLESTDLGFTWNKKQNGLGSIAIELKQSFSPGEQLFAFQKYCTETGESELYRSVDSGISWDYVNKAWANSSCGFYVDSNGIFYRFPNYSIAYSNDDGKTWHGRTIPDFYYGGSFSVSPFIENLFLLSTRDTGILGVSSDAGISWRTTGFNMNGVRNFYFGNTVIYAASDNSLYRSLDRGETWEPCAVPEFTISIGETSIAIGSGSENNVYVGTTDKGLLVSEDQCNTWRYLDNGLTDQNITTIAVDPNDNAKLYVGTPGGVYVSLNGGDSWFKVNDGLLGATIIYSIAVNPTNGTVYASTPYGIFKLVQK